MDDAPTLPREVDVWIDDALRKLQSGELTAFDFEVLRYLVGAQQRRRRVLVLFTRDALIQSDVIAWNDPDVPDPPTTPESPPYRTVRDAIADGWELVTTPPPWVDPEDGITGALPFEYVLHRMEPA
jgi:hypothetical protein